MHISAYRPVAIFSAGLALGFALTAIGISGCGGKPSGKREAAADDQTDVDAAGSESAEDSPNPKKTGKSKKKGKGNEVGYIDQIPSDVWPEVWLKQPLSVAGESGTTAGQGAEPPMTLDSAANPTAPTELAANTGKAATPAPKAGAADWPSLITGEVLADESKAIKNKLTQQLQDVGWYDRTYKEMRVDATVLAVLAAIAPDVPDTPGWKTNAKFIRDVASEVAGESKANGPKFHKKAKEAYDKLDALLGGSKPPDVGDAADHVNFSEVADRRYLMKRMERTANWMKSEVNTEAIFKKEAAKLTQEASVLAVLGKVITTPDYADHDIDEYKGYADAVSQSGRSIVGAVKDGDFKAYTTALDSCQKACAKCHEQFKNN